MENKTQIAFYGNTDIKARVIDTLNLKNSLLREKIYNKNGILAIIKVYGKGLNVFYSNKNSNINQINYQFLNSFYVNPNKLRVYEKYNGN